MIYKNEKLLTKPIISKKLSFVTDLEVSYAESYIITSYSNGSLIKFTFPNNKVLFYKVFVFVKQL